MKRIITHLSTLALVAGMGAFATSCTPTNTPVTTGDGIPTGLKVNSLSNTSIGVTWQRNSDVNADTVTATPSNGSAPILTYAASGQASAVINGLTDGQAYAITVHSSGGTSAATTWAPADRSGPFTLYETSDNTSGHFSGLDLDFNNVHTVSVGGGNATADVVLASDTSAAALPSGIFLGSAGVQGTGIAPGVAKVTLFNYQSVLVNGGLDSDYYSSDLSGLILGTSLIDPTATTSADFNGTTATSLGANDPNHDAIIRVKTQSGHYVRIDVIRQPTGLLWKTVNGFNAIDVKVSEQSVAGEPYAARGTKFYPNPNIPRQSSNRAFIAN